MKVKNSDVLIPLRRPWQGTTLGVLNLLVFVGQALFLILTLSLAVGFNFLALPLWHEMGGMPFMIGMGMSSSFLFIPAILISLLPFLILQYYLTKGVFAGKRWAVITSLVLTSLFALGFNSILFILPPLALLYLSGVALFIYLEVICLKHPFYKNEASA